uniref:Uncharacterized protein n=1 Tax=Caenorhabditis tropicalis TaxID=1561998 RepID=A0A1I7TG50_9PELO
MRKPNGKMGENERKRVKIEREKRREWGFSPSEKGKQTPECGRYLEAFAGAFLNIIKSTPNDDMIVYLFTKYIK